MPVVSESSLALGRGHLSFEVVHASIPPISASVGSAVQALK